VCVTNADGVVDVQVTFNATVTEQHLHALINWQQFIDQ